MDQGGTPREVRLLGPVRAAGPGVDGAGAPRSRTLLALLALAPGGFVESSALVDGLWGQDLPRAPRDALAVVVRRVRAWIGGDAVVTEGGGYRLDVAPAQVDRSRFLDAATRALDDGGTLADVDAALGEWAGEPFGGCAPSGPLDADRAVLTERRLRLVERRAELLLAAERPEDAVATITEVLHDHRGRESLTVLLMTALGRLGRRDEALAAFDTTRRHVVEEFGLDPGPALQAAVRRMRSGVVRPTRTPIVGRGALLDELASLPPGGVVVIEGEAGIGKSSLVRELLRRASTRGTRTATGTVDDHGAPLGGWREALAGLADLDERLTPAAVHAALTAAAPVVVALDDVHRADSASTALLAGLTARGLPAGVTLLLAARRPDVDAHPVWDAALADLDARRLALGALDASDVADLVRARLTRLDAGAARRVAAFLLDRTRGHPLHLRTLLDVLADQPDETACRAVAARVPERLRPLLDHQVASLPASARAAVEALAVLAPIDRAGLAEVVEDDDTDLLAPAVSAGLVEVDGERVAVRHELVADAARDRVPAIVAAQLHLARLDAIERGDFVTPSVSVDARLTFDPFTRLRHTLGAGTLVTDERRATARWRAGRAAYGRRGIPEALALLVAAADDLPDEHRADLLVHRGLALDALRREDAGDVLDAGMDAALKDDAHPLAVRAALGDEPLGTTVTGDAARLARLRRMVGVVLDDHDRFEVLVAMVREEGAVHGALPDGLLARSIEAGRGLPEHPRTSARLRALHARSLLDTPVAARDRLAVASEAYALARDLDDDALRLDATELSMSAALAAGHPDLARERAGELRLLAERHHRPRSRWAADLVETGLLLCAGELDAAEVRASAALGDGTALGLADARIAYGAHLLVRHLLQGRAGELLDLARGAAATMHNTAAWTAATALALSQTGDPEAARSILADYRQRRAERPGLWFDRPGLAIAAAAAFSCADTATAELVRDALPADPDAVVLVGFGAAVIGPAMLWTGLAAWTFGDRDTAREHLAHVAARTGALGWTAWATAASTARDAIDDPAVALPLGLVRP